MTLYVVLFVFLLLYGLLEVSNISIEENMPQKRKHWNYAHIPFFIIIFMGVFREVSVGYDSDSYYVSYWLQIDRYTWHEILTGYSKNNGFLFVLKVIALFTDDYWIARVALFLLTFGLYFAVIKNESPYPTVSLLIFVGLSTLSLMFGILRQALAGAICFSAYKQLKRGSWLKCVILILVSATIHKTALLCLFMPVFRVIRMKKFSELKLVCLSALAYIVFVVAIPFVTFFYEDGRYLNVGLRNGGYGMLFCMMGVIVLALHLIKKTKSRCDSDMSYIFNLSCCALFVQIGAIQWSLLTRTTIYFSIYWCILFPELLSKLPQKKRVTYFLILATVFGFLYFYTLDDVNLFVMHRF